VSLRRQLPAWSPITLAALGAGLRAALSGAGARETLSARIRSTYGCSEVVLTDSGTSALAMAFRVAAGDPTPVRVALPAYGCFDLMTAADAVQAEVVLYDLDPATLAPDLESLRAALRHGPHAVVIAHWYGVPVDLGPLRQEVAGAGAVLVEDAAQGVGASVRGRPVGSFGELAVLSFGRGKGRTGGRGGALLVNEVGQSPPVLREAQRLVRPGKGAGDLVVLGALWMLGRPSLFWLPAMLPGLRLGETVYRSPHPMGGLSSSAAAVVARIWERSDQEAQMRRGHATRWLSSIRESPELDCLEVPTGAEPGWLRLPLRARGGTGQTLRAQAAVRHGIMPGYPATLNRLGRSVLNSRDSFPGAQVLVEECFTLPTHRMLAEVDFEAVQGMLRVGA
jgi:perosamine synthetase